MRTGVALCSLETLRLRQKQKIWTISFINRKAFWTPPIAGNERHLRIFEFLIGCFEAKWGRLLVQKYLAHIDFNRNSSFIRCYEINFRILEYCDDAPDLVFVNFMKHISLNHPSVTSMENRRQPEIKLIFKKMLQFMDRHCQVIVDLAEMFSLIEGKLNNMFLSFVTDDYYADELEHFLSVLSPISPEGDAIFKIFHEAVTFLDMSVISGSILSQVLRNFKFLDRKNVFERMRRMVLTIAPRSTFLEIYGSLMLPDPVPAELGIGQLLERNSMSQMTLLHLAAFHGQEQVVDRCLKAMHQINSSSNTEDFTKRDERMNAVTLSNDGNDYTPFLVAAAIGNECIAEKMPLFFEKDQLRGFLSQSNGFLHDAIRAAIEFKRADLMFRLILKIVN